MQVFTVHILLYHSVFSLNTIDFFADGIIGAYLLILVVIDIETPTPAPSYLILYAGVWPFVFITIGLVKSFQYNMLFKYNNPGKVKGRN